MFKNPAKHFLNDNFIMYEALGDENNGGVSLDTVIECLEAEYVPLISVSYPAKLFPFIFGTDSKLHPLFKEDCDYENPFCFDYEYEPTQAPMALFDECCLEIIIVDQLLRYGICHLCFGEEELSPDGWVVYDDFCLVRHNISEVVKLLRRIQHASLSELLA